MDEKQERNGGKEKKICGMKKERIVMKIRKKKEKKGSIKKIKEE